MDSDGLAQLEQRRRIHVERRNPGPGLRRADGQRPAQTPARAGDQDGFS